MLEDDDKKNKKLRLILRKRRIPMNHPYLKGDAARKNTGAANTRIFAYKHFETHMGTFFRKLTSDSPADAPGRSRNQGDFSFQ